jgi:hypothetical protein
MTDVTDVFPSRPLVAKRTGASRIGGWLVILFGFGIASVFWAWLADDLWRDYQISTNYQLAPDANILNGKCSTHQWFLADCTATITDAKGTTRTVDITFLDVHSGDYQTRVVRSRTDTKLLTLELGVDRIIDRILTFVGFVGLGLAVSVAGVVMLLRAAALREAVSRPAVMKPVVAAVLELEKTLLFCKVVYQYSVDGKPRKAVGFLGRKEMPFFVDAQRSKVLAVIPSSVSTPILLNEQLQALDLTDQERAAIRAAR